MCLAQGLQRSDAGEARTRGPSVSSQALYHWATVLPFPKVKHLSSGTETNRYWEMPTCDHLKYKMDNPILTAFICMGISIKIQRVKESESCTNSIFLTSNLLYICKLIVLTSSSCPLTAIRLSCFSWISFSKSLKAISISCFILICSSSSFSTS